MVQCGTMFHDGVFVSVGKCGRSRALGYLKIDGVNECPSSFSLTARSSQQTEVRWTLDIVLPMPEWIKLTNPVMYSDLPFFAYIENFFSKTSGTRPKK